MAASTTKVGETLAGPLRTKYFSITLTGVTEVTLTEADHGMRNVIFAVHNNETTENQGLVVITLVNTVTVSSCTSGDVVKLMLVGN
tara:strand:+ start:4813 stop:5070 length:258 start_codon:yes stop_codon:yes gene_type:complete